MARNLIFRIEEVEEIYDLCSENKDADQLCLSSHISKKQVSHDAAHFSFVPLSVIIIICLGDS